MNAKDVMQGLDKMYQNPHCELEYKTNFELLVAVILSAQCTDARVNQTTRELFKVASVPEDFVNMPLGRIEQLIHSCGFYHNKAKSIQSASRDIIDRFGGEVPSDFEDLLSLAGVGRKTANVMISEAFGGDALAVDTHVLRTANRLGLVKTDNPNVCEAKLKKIFPKSAWSKLHYQLVLFGRYTCKAIKPDCHSCAFRDKCKNARLTIK
jgi:endonuclease-3